MMLTLFFLFLTLFVVYVFFCVLTGNVLSAHPTEYSVTENGLIVEEFVCRHAWCFKRVVYRRDPAYDVWESAHSYYSQNGEYFSAPEERFTSIMRGLKNDAKRKEGTSRAWATKKVEK